MDSLTRRFIILSGLAMTRNPPAMSRTLMLRLSLDQRRAILAAAIADQTAARLAAAAAQPAADQAATDQATTFLTAAFAAADATGTAAQAAATRANNTHTTAVASDVAGATADLAAAQAAVAQAAALPAAVSADAASAAAAAAAAAALALLSVAASDCFAAQAGVGSDNVAVGRRAAEELHGLFLALGAPPPASRAPLNSAARGTARGPGPLQLNIQLNQRLVRAMDAKELLLVYAQHGRSFNAVNLSTCWSMLGRVSYREKDLAQKLMRLRKQTLDTLGARWDARGLANLAHALGNLMLGGDAWRSLWDKIAVQAAKSVLQFNSQGLANTAYAYAKTDRAAPALFDAIAVEVVRRVHAFTPHEFTPQGLTTTAYAYAKADHAAPALFDAIAAEVARRVREFNPQDLANTVWAYAKAGHAAPVLFDAIAAEVAQRVREFNAQDLANTAWAYATAGHAVPELLDAISKEAASRVSEFNPQNLSNMAWAYATARHPAPALLDAIAAEVVRRLCAFNPQERREFNTQNLSNVALAYATAGHAATALLDAIAAEAAPRILAFNAQDICNMAWAYAAANHPADTSGLFGQLFAQRCDACASRSELTIRNMRQLHQWALWHAGERGRSDDLPTNDLLQKCRATFSNEVGQPSEMQRDVGVTLASLASSLELITEDEVVLHEGYSLDFMVKWNKYLVGVEVDGPSHFVGREPTGATLLKRRQLRHLSIRLVSVPHWEWERLDSDNKRKERTNRIKYMQSHLDIAVHAS